MTNEATFANGMAVGKMYAATPWWWAGFFWGQVFGTVSKALDDIKEAS